MDALHCDGQWPLSAASQQGHSDIVQLLLERGAEPDSVTIYSWTGLLFAAAAGHVRISELLLQGGASVNHRDALSEGPLTLAAKTGHLDIVEKVFEFGPRQKTLVTSKRLISRVDMQRKPTTKARRQLAQQEAKA